MENINVTLPIPVVDVEEDDEDVRIVTNAKRRRTLEKYTADPAVVPLLADCIRQEHHLGQAPPPWFHAAVQDALEPIVARLDAMDARRRNTGLSRVGMNIVELPKLRPGFGQGNAPDDFAGDLDDIQVGMTPTQAGLPNLFPATMAAIMNLTMAQINQLTWFYNEPFAPGEHRGIRREAVRSYFIG